MMKLSKLVMGALLVVGCTRESATAVEEPAGGVESIFGVKLGQVMPQEKCCDTNDTYSLVYEYEPAKQFNAFHSYAIFASAKTRHVYMVRAVYVAENDSEAEQKIAEVANILEMKYGKRFWKIGKNRVAKFPNGDTIRICLDSTPVFTAVRIDATSEKFNKIDNSESKALKMDVFAKDLEAINIIPRVKKGEMASVVNGIFGREFGSVLPKDSAYERLNDGTIVDEFCLPKGFFYKYTIFKAFATPDTRKIYMIHAICPDDDSKSVDKTVEILEILLGKTFKECDDGSKYVVCAGKNGEVGIIVQKESGLLYLSIVDRKLYEVAKDERARRAAAADLDAL